MSPVLLFFLKNDFVNGFFGGSICILRAFLVVQMVKNLPAMQETWVQSLGQEYSLEKGIATHSSILAWEIPWTVGCSQWGHNLDKTEISEHSTHSTFIKALLTSCIYFDQKFSLINNYPSRIIESISKDLIL